MYAQFFGLGREPFSIAPDPHFLYMSEQHREALAHLLYGLGGGGGFVLLTGDIGAGKTTVCRCFLEQVPPHCDVAYVFNPRLTALELLQTVCTEFGLAPAAASVKAQVDALNVFLLAGHAAGRQAVLVIDEAQSLGAEVLEQLRLLTNLETAERKLLRIILIGQPELREMLARPRLEQLAQRVVARYHLGALPAGQTPQYIRHRLAVAGRSAALPFNAAALSRIHALTAGVPRRINLLADRALLGAYAQGLPVADRRTVDQAAREVFGASAAGWGRPGRLALATALLLLLATLAGWGLSRPPAAAVRAAALARPASPPLPEPVERGAVPAVAVAASAASAVVAGVPESDPTLLLAAAHRLQATALRELALRWQLAVVEGEPCAAAAPAGLACLHSAAGGLALARQLARPAVLGLQSAEGPRYALLVALDGREATLEVGAQRFVLSLPALARIWRGDFATYWRPPPGWRADVVPGPEFEPWLERRLRLAMGDDAAPLRQRIWAFQLAEGLMPDGVAGPVTLMRLNRKAGAGEPQLEGPY
jgi:general secretion pathway protein A